MSIPNLLDSKLQVNAIVQIEGNQVNFVSLWLDQIYGEHYNFSVTIDYDILDKSFMGDPSKQFELLGGPVTIKMQHDETGGKAYTFNGVITNVKNSGKEGRHGHVVIEGASPTIMLEQGKRMEVYSDMPLTKVFEDVTSRVNPQNLQKSGNPLLSGNIDFLMQYNESDWQFLRRVAYLYGENLFYTGEELVFGEYNEPDTVTMMYDKEITGYEFCSRLLPNTFINYHYLAQDDTIFEKNSPNDVGDDKYVKVALERGQDLTQVKSPKVPLEVPVGDKATLDEIVKRKKERTAAQTVVLIGEAKTFEACVGRLINVSLADGIANGKSLGTYRVIKSKHVIDQNHRYKNYFEAVPSALKTVPVAEIEMPSVNDIIATVSDNADPNGQGRIQVDFPFADNYSFAWLRVMSPDAGASDKVSMSRGMMFIPEPGDQVVVGFEFNDPNRPFVRGSMFHGKNTGGGGQGNKTKSLCTRSGCAVTLDDDKGSVEVKDPSGNILFMDGAGNTSITSVNSIVLKCGESTIYLDKDGKIAIEGKEVYISGSNEVNIASGGEGGASGMKIDPSTISMGAESELNMGGKAAAINIGSEGGQISIVSGAEVSIGGTTVHIN